MTIERHTDRIGSSRADGPYGVWRVTSRAALSRQIAIFFATDGKGVIHAEPARFFEVPIVLPLPEGLSYIP